MKENELSLTEGIKDLLTAEASAPYENEKKRRVETESADTRSVLEVALEAGMTLQEYVQKFPESAIMFAESSLAEWLKIQSSAAIEGAITTEAGKFAVTKNQTKLISDRVEMAKEQLESVMEYALTSYRTGEQRKDHLVRILYNKAGKGDMRAIEYLINRNDGMPTQANVQDQYDGGYAYAVYQIVNTLFNKQLEVLNAGSGTMLICCSRRAGKTHLLVAILLIEALRRPNTMCIYIGETMELSEQLIDTAANEIIDKCNLRDKRGRRLNWKKLDNNSVILVRGLSNTKDPDQIRGNKAKVIVIDEFFHLKSDLLEYLQKEVLEPMQLDYADDYKFICAGTPPSVKGTFGEFAWKTWNVPHFFWTWRDNPYPTAMEARKEYIENKLKEKGLTWESTYARREYNGEWAYDDDLLLYPEFHTYDPKGELPKFHIDRVMFGIDYGVSDNDVLLGIAWDDSAKRGYVFHEDKFNRLDIKDRTISQLQYLKGRVRFAWELALDFFPGMDVKEANKRILWDADDNDQHLTDDLNTDVRLESHPDLRLNIQNAHKTDKVIMFDKIRDLLRTAGLLLIEKGKTAEECSSTILLRGPNGEVYPEVDNKAYHPDILPAMRYALYNVLA